MNISVHNLNISYDRSGIGPTVLLLHGWGTSKQNLNEIAQALAGNFDVISLDLPGFGASEEPQGAWHLRDYVECVSDVLKDLEVHQLYCAVGHSFGGRLIIKGVAEGLLEPEKVVLIGSAGIKHSDTMRNLFYRAVAKMGKAFFSLPGLAASSSAMRRKLYAAAGSEDYLMASGTMKQIFLNTIAEDLADAGKKMVQPTLLIWGSEDRDAPLADARYFHDVMPASTLKIVQEAGHFVHNEKPRKVIGWIRSFLDS